MHADRDVDSHFRHLIGILRPARSAKKSAHRQVRSLLNGGDVGDPLHADRHQGHLAMNLAQALSDGDQLRALTVTQLDQQLRH